MFKFFVLSNSGSGEARRHFPFTSIIHKHVLPLFFVLVVLLFSSVPVSVHALADPVFQPVYDTQFYQLPQFVDPLNSTQQDIFYFILGSQVVEYAGLSGYEVENPYQDPSSVGEWFKKIGIDLYNDVLESFAIAGAPVVAGAKWIKDLYANIAGAANFAGAFNNSSFNDFLSDVQSNGLSLELYPSIFGALNQYFAINNGLFDWQYNELEWVSELPLNVVSMSDSLSIEYLDFLNVGYGLDSIVRRSYSPGSYFYNYAVSAVQFVSYHNIFINTNLHRVTIVDDDGNEIPSTFSDKEIYAYYSGSNLRLSKSSDTFYGSDFKSNYSSSYTPLEIARSLFDGTSDSVLSSSNYYDNYFVSDFVDSVYYGFSWDTAVLLHNSDDLNFEQNNNQDTLAPIINTLLDIKGLINDILEQNELKPPALDNLTDLNGDPLPASQLQPVSVAVELPDSGIAIPTNIFGGFFNSNDGFISYLWYMTKPLVIYTHDLLDCFWFGPVDGFDWSGPAPIVFGVISLGLIGGLIVKMLL